LNHFMDFGSADNNLTKEVTLTVYIYLTSVISVTSVVSSVKKHNLKKL